MAESLRDDLQRALGTAYTIQRELGGGGMSRVFLARDEALSRDVVIKLLSPDLAEGLSAERFTREIKLAAVLQEPHIVPVLSAGQTDGGLPWYTMPFVEGESLRQRLTRGALPLAEAAGLLRNVAQALSYAHAHGIVHRDIKPDNILISSGTAVVADFGIAKAVSAAKTQAPGGTLTQVGTSLGTPAYMAPEQALGDAGTDHRADLYAWGVVAYEALAGQHVFPGRTSTQQFVAAHIAEAPRPLAEVAPAVPVALANVVMQCLEKDPTRRPASAAEIVDAIANVSHAPSMPVATPAPRVSTRRSAPRRLLLGGIALAVVAASLLLWLSRRESPRSRGETSPGANLVVIPTVAVLPFTNVGGDAKDEYFSDGMTDELAQALAQLPGLRVAGRASSYSFKGKSATAQDVGHALNVAGVIEGTVRRAGDQLRITAQLTNAKDGLVLWSRTVQKKATDVFQVQDEVTKELVTALAPALRGQPAEQVAVENRGTAHVEAYDLYLRGKYFWTKRGADNLNRARDYFLRAIALDPSFARAHAGLAQTYIVMRYYVNVRADSMANLAAVSATRALAIDSTLSDAHAALAYSLLARVRLAEAEEHFRKAVALEPSNANTHFWHAMNLSALGLLDSAFAEAARAVALDPLSATFVTFTSYVRRLQGRIPEALAHARRGLELDSTQILNYQNRAAAYVYISAPDSALAELERAAKVTGQGPLAGPLVIVAHAQLGHWREVDRLATTTAGAQVVLSMINRDHASAIDALERDLTPEGGAIFQWFSPGCDGLFTELHAEPRFQALMARLGMRMCDIRLPLPLPRRPRQ